MKTTTLWLQVPERTLRHVEARLVSLGFHPKGIVPDGIVLHTDKLFCVCCGQLISQHEFEHTLVSRGNVRLVPSISGGTLKVARSPSISQGRCKNCREHNCVSAVPVEEFFHHHGLLELFIGEVR